MTDTLVPFPISWRRAIVESELSSTVRHVALTLSMYMSELGDSAHPGAARLARDTKLHVSTVRAALAELVAGGWLALVEQGGRKGDRRRANVYAAKVPSLPLPLVQADPSESSTHRQDRARPVAQDDPISPENSPATPPNPPQAGGDEHQHSPDPERDALFRVLADVTHTTPRTVSERRERGRRVSDLLAKGATPDEIRARAAQWHRLNPTSAGQQRKWPTDRQLVRRWDLLVPDVPKIVCPDCGNRGVIFPLDSDVAVECTHPRLEAA